MDGICFPKRFLSFLLLSCLFIGLQSFTHVKTAPQDLTRGVIIVVEEIFMNVQEGEGPVWIGGNPATASSWVKVKAENEITNFAITNSEGAYLVEETVNSDEFKFMPTGFEPANYHLHFYIEGVWYTKTLVVE